MTTPASQRNLTVKFLIPVVAIVALAIAALAVIRQSVAPRKGGDQTEESADAEAADISVGAVLPDFTFHPFGGGTVQASALESKVTLINFWATWCEACMVEMPSLVKLRNHFKDRGFEIAAVNLDENPALVVPRTVEKLSLPFPIYTDPSSQMGEIFDVHGIPLTVIMNKERKILFIQNGERDWYDKEMISLVEKWISG